MLTAIAVYLTDPVKNSFTKHIFSQQIKSGYGFFPIENQLEDVESFLPRTIPQIQTYEIRPFKKNNCFHYLAKPHEDNFLVAISSQYPLDEVELDHLVRNIMHIHLRVTRVNTKLDDIILNPQGFIGKDLLLVKTQENLDGLKKQAFRLIELTLERGENINSLAIKAEMLNIHADDFKRKTAPKCCG